MAVLMHFSKLKSDDNSPRNDIFKTERLLVTSVGCGYIRRWVNLSHFKRRPFSGLKTKFSDI